MRIAERFGALLLALNLGLLGGPARAEDAPRTSVLILTIDTLRADRLSIYGYERPTSPHMDALMGAGVLFRQARTVEPLTGPALCSMMTSRFPHESGATRNGLRMRPGLPSLPRLLADAGYRTAAVVGNWTLRDKLTGLGDHFADYHEVLPRRRWAGMVGGEASAEEVNAAALEWLSTYDAGRDRPFLLWVHYVDPHAPYQKREAHLEPLGLARRGKLGRADRYDTEVAYTDRFVGELIAALDGRGLLADTLTVVTSDHGESLGEHDYWGHGRNLFEPNLRVPMALVWPGRIEPGTVDVPASTIDVAPTIAGLLGLAAPEGFRGYDWAGVLLGKADPPPDRATQHQAHRGAVLSRHDSETARRAGLLEVGVVLDGQKEILRVKKNRKRWRFDLHADPRELESLAEPRSEPTDGLRTWMEVVDFGLRQSDELPADPLDDETIERLRALGYAD
jgi:arylsulfatase A-like enzyme